MVIYAVKGSTFIKHYLYGHISIIVNVLKYSLCTNPSPPSMLFTTNYFLYDKRRWQYSLTVR